MEERKKFRLADVVLSVICVVFVAEAAAPVASIGNSQYFWWLFMIAAFLLPYGLISSELGTAFPGDGGLYDWIHTAWPNSRWGARASWYYWINFPLWMASLAVMCPELLGYVFGWQPGPEVTAHPWLAHLGVEPLGEVFDGDWLLTVAAYNSGEGRVLKAMKANKARGKSTDFWSLSLPQETKIYVPKMLALSDILKNSKRYGVQLPTPDESRALARVRLSNPVDIQQVADMTGMSVSKLKTFNAGVKGSTLGASGPQYVMVPQKHAEQLRESLASGEIAAVQSTLIADASSVNSRSYKVRSGDTLSGIASRLGVNAKDLQQWNNLRSSGLKVGQTLTVGAGSSAQRLASNSDSITYRVRKGDSLSSIAKRHGVNIKDVMRWNNDTDNLKPGDQLTLFVKNSATPDS